MRMTNLPRLRLYDMKFSSWDHEVIEDIIALDDTRTRKVRDRWSTEYIGILEKTAE